MMSWKSILVLYFFFNFIFFLISGVIPYAGSSFYTYETLKIMYRDQTGEVVSFLVLKIFFWKKWRKNTLKIFFYQIKTHFSPSELFPKKKINLNFRKLSNIWNFFLKFSNYPRICKRMARRFYFSFKICHNSENWFICVFRLWSIIQKKHFQQLSFKKLKTDEF